jgi:hypothetical protein
LVFHDKRPYQEHRVFLLAWEHLVGLPSIPAAIGIIDIGVPYVDKKRISLVNESNTSHRDFTKEYE